jgi:hypothetical protein
MKRIITHEHALRIANKLKAVMERGTKHDMAYIYYGGVEIASFGIRRGSEKDKGHDHISKALYVGPHDAKLLAQCPLLLEDWLEILRKKGKLAPN